MRGIAIYTGLRVALLVLVWLVVQAVTPLRGLLAIAVALVISGIVSFIALDRPRDRASVGLAGAFRRINDRIEASRVAEDVDDEPSAGGGEAHAEQHPVDEHEQAGPLQDGHEVPADGVTEDGGDGPDGEDAGQQRDPREGETQPRG